MFTYAKYAFAVVTFDCLFGTAQRAFDTFYLAVDNSDYSCDSDESGFQDLRGANKSASIVADYLKCVGGRRRINDHKQAQDQLL